MARPKKPSGALKTGPEGTHRRATFHLPAKVLDDLDRLVVELKIRARQDRTPMPNASEIVAAGLRAEIAKRRKLRK